MKPFTYKIQRPINGFSVRSLILFKLNWIGLSFAERPILSWLLMKKLLTNTG